MTLALRGDAKSVRSDREILDHQAIVTGAILGFLEEVGYSGVLEGACCSHKSLGFDAVKSAAFDIPRKAALFAVGKGEGRGCMERECGECGGFGGFCWKGLGLKGLGDRLAFGGRGGCFEKGDGTCADVAGIACVQNVSSGCKGDLEATCPLLNALVIGVRFGVGCKDIRDQVA